MDLSDFQKFQMITQAGQGIAQGDPSGAMGGILSALMKRGGSKSLGTPPLAGQGAFGGSPDVGDTLMPGDDPMMQRAMQQMQQNGLGGMPQGQILAMLLQNMR